MVLRETTDTELVVELDVTGSRRVVSKDCLQESRFTHSIRADLLAQTKVSVSKSDRCGTATLLPT
jgi:hypothetical protein